MTRRRIVESISQRRIWRKSERETRGLSAFCYLALDQERADGRFAIGHTAQDRLFGHRRRDIP